jgi:hypothetical protein
VRRVHQHSSAAVLQYSACILEDDDENEYEDDRPGCSEGCGTAWTFY